ncbi:MAG TPA: phospholipid carrier-dependent glycosyltransferase [Candidatus Thermoplasmatota archaeon]|nr:phospholipid carrier-dependent glycosyltransferase [Candidatus Thermoplasmatota archaeon]
MRRRGVSMARSPALRLAREHGPVLLVLALALFLRLRDLEPVTFYGDDAEYGIVASYLAHNPLDLSYPRLSAFADGPFVSQPPLVIYMFAAGFALTGGLDTAAVVVSALLGAATVLVVYAIGVMWRDRATGFIAAAFLAVMPFHVALSRKAFLEAGLAFFMALAVLVALWYLRAPSARRAILVGVAIGLAALAKLPGFLIGVVILLYAGVEIAALLAERRAGDADAAARLRAIPRHAVRGALVALAFPVAWVLFVVARGGWKELVKKMAFQGQRVAGGAQDAATASQPWTWYLGEHEFAIPALVDPTIYALAFAGCALLLAAYALRPVRERRNALVLLWVLVVFAFFALADRKVWFYTLPLAPAIALAAAYPIALARDGVAWLVARGAPSLAPRAPVRVGLAVLAVLVASVPAWAAAETALAREDAKFGQGLEEAALYVDAHGGGGQIGTLLGRFSLAFYNPDDITYHYFVDNGYGQKGGYVDAEIRAGRLRWLVYDTYLDNPEERAWMDRLLSENPHALEATYGNDWGQVRVYRFT